LVALKIAPFRGKIMLPIIDIADLAGANTVHLSRVGFEIGRVCRDTGFFYVVNHGIDAETIDGVMAMSKAFFDQPPERKAPLAIHAHSGNRGYVQLGTEALDPGRNIDNKEAFNIGLDLAANDPEVLAGVLSRAPNQWPELVGFRPAMLDYFAQLHRLGCDLHRAIACDLGVDPDYFEPLFTRPMATLRLLHYPDAVNRRAQYGAGAHTDYGNLTILLTDDAGGLEVQTIDGAWIEAPHVPGAFICNIGDCLMRWTNDVYKSTPHRVIEPVGRDRYSIAYFHDPNPEAIVSVLETCYGPHQAKRYEPITAADYLASRLAETYGFTPGKVSTA
jgi:isopenicillin N synthase-like dioxygenase